MRVLQSALVFGVELYADKERMAGSEETTPPVIKTYFVFMIPVC